MKFWFTRRKWGWGWMPVSFEGWLLSLVFLVVLVVGHQRFGTDTPLFIVYLLCSVLVFSFVADQYTDKPLLFKK